MTGEQGILRSSHVRIFVFLTKSSRQPRTPRHFRRGSALQCAVLRPADCVLLRHQLCAVLRSRPEPPARWPAARRPPRSGPTRKARALHARIPPRFLSQPAGSLEHAVHSCTCYFTVRVMRQGSNASKLQPADTAANQFLAVLLPVWAQVCG